ncbi:hypothetical protein COS33_00880 [Candidatus Wolfebacteria bacterium CG02_land_8_20_14_3_00_37_12]|uniref:DUF192 domain-containing protein n=2 Tax=Candidatus Wolfeibacteriota TaxID=1752735 RepID=A0A2M7Q8C1_9BACT|nr:MAG: hypothetical protein COS33_00880 [Candidatus Wolfebacteria bacterium CG02_land_8_20_14_3_00_37_12]PIY59419.1 MAG: hypothetical protein COY96_01925 [Candidatus Wolfebacteria bacterium CG_4_10_14_0_8_um_filter_37_11]
MRKFKHIVLIILGIFVGLVLFFIGKANLANDAEKIILNISGKEYSLYTARTVLEKAKGLSGITELKGADGMVFFFSPESKPTFWNKETYLDLELIWMNGDEIVGRDFLPPEDSAGLITKSAPAKIDKVVEIVIK